MYIDNVCMYLHTYVQTYTSISLSMVVLNSGDCQGKLWLLKNTPGKNLKPIL